MRYAGAKLELGTPQVTDLPPECVANETLMAMR